MLKIARWNIIYPTYIATKMPVAIKIIILVAMVLRFSFLYELLFSSFVRSFPASAFTISGVAIRVVFSDNLGSVRAAIANLPAGVPASPLKAAAA